MKRIFAILLTFAILTIASTTAIALPEGTVARLGKGSISFGDRAVQFSPDGTLLAVATFIGVYLYDAQTHEEVAFLETDAGMFSVAFSPDGRLLASGSDDRTIKLWDVAQGKLIDTLTGHTSAVYSVSFSPDGRLLASGIYDGTIDLWDVSQRKLIDTLTGHTSVVSSVSFNPDGRILASGSWDGTIRLWDVEKRKLIDTLTGHVYAVSSVSFSPDGRILASGSWDGTILLWDMEPYIIPQRHFNPEADGYSFRNFSDPSLFVWDVFRDTFGKEQVEYGDTGIHKPIADIFFVEHYLPFIGHQVLGGGVCNGMAATSLLFFENPSALAAFREPKFSATAKNTNQLEPTHELKYHIEVYQGYQLGLLIKDWMANQDKDPATLFNIIKDSLRKSSGVALASRGYFVNRSRQDQQVINIYGEYKGKMAGHSVVPYKIEEKGNNIYWVYVYDCNYPFWSAKALLLHGASAETDALQSNKKFLIQRSASGDMNSHRASSGQEMIRTS